MTERQRRAVRLALWLHGGGVLLTAVFLPAVFLTRDWGFFRVGECWIRRILHIYCPGCGATRGLIALLTLHPLRAFLYYPTLYLAIGLILWADLWLILSLVRRREELLSHIHGKLFYAIPVMAVVTAVLRTVLAYTVGFDPLGDLTGL